MGSAKILEELEEITAKVQGEFTEERRVLSFHQYLELFAGDPVRYSRDAACYLRDMFDHYGREQSKKPWGTLSKFKLFHLPFLEHVDAQRDGLVGQEHVQAEIYRVLNNFVQEGRPNRLLLLHGPNGSAKSTVAACIMRALEDYSAQPEGALYRFHWVFPNQSKLRGSIGFGGKRAAAAGADESYAHLPDEEIDARLFIEVRDHPLFLIPQIERKGMIERLYASLGNSEPPPRWILKGSLSHKSKQVFDALLTSYDGSLDQVLRHVQVERYFISRRYRTGAVTLGPQLSVDAGERQITADRSLGALPSSLQSVTLFEAHGELIEAAGGLLEFSDLLKRPLDAFKYLQITAETGEVALSSQNVQVNCVLMASGNEVHLSAFRDHPEYESFRGRLELIRVPYLLNWRDEMAIYDAQVAAHVRGHVAPHATAIAAMFAVLTRMRRPNPERYDDGDKALVSDLTAAEKLDLYADASTPSHLSEESAALLRSLLPKLYGETDGFPIYEGSVGASPREMRTVLLDAGQNPHYGHLSPFAVLDELKHLSERKNEYGFLQEDPLPGGYHDTDLFLEILSNRLHDTLEDEFRIASGLVDETRYAELFDRYVTHVSFWVKGEKLFNPLTGQYEDPNPQLLEEVETLLGVSDDRDRLRHSLISTIAAWAIDHPDEPVVNSRVFADQIRRMRNAVFEERRSALAKLCRDLVILLREEGHGLTEARSKGARVLLSGLVEQFGYNDASAADAAASLLRERFRDHLN